LGHPLTLIRESGRTRVHRRGELLLVPAGAAGKPALERFYRRWARIEIAAKLDQACGAAGSAYSSLAIRNQRTRWASCSSTGAMSFNWRLLLAPEPVLDYVVWHEVCHLEVMDHSRRFWALVARFCPDHREHAAWLRRHGKTLAL
jgi:predicted metal-dependent hydrolase